MVDMVAYMVVNMEGDKVADIGGGHGGWQGSSSVSVTWLERPMGVKAEVKQALRPQSRPVEPPARSQAWMAHRLVKYTSYPLYMYTWKNIFFDTCQFQLHSSKGCCAAYRHNHLTGQHLGITIIIICTVYLPGRLHKIRLCRRTWNDWWWWKSFMVYFLRNLNCVKDCNFV